MKKKLIAAIVMVPILLISLITIADTTEPMRDYISYIGIDLGHITDTTITRSAAGVIAIEGVDHRKAPIYDSRDYATYNAAITAIGGATAEFHIWGTSQMNASVTAPATMTVVVHRGGQINTDGGNYQPTFDGGFVAGPYQIWDNTSAAPVFQSANATGGASLQYIYPNWWGTVGRGNGTDDSDEFQAALSATALAKNGAALKILPTGWGGNTNYYRFTTGLLYAFTGNAQTLRIEGSGMGSYLFFVGAIDGISISNPSANYAANAKNRVEMRNVWVGGDDDTLKGFELSLIRNSLFESCWVTGYGDIGWSLEGCFGNQFNNCGVGASFGSPGNVAYKSPTPQGWHLTTDAAANTASNVNIFTGGKTQTCTEGTLIDGTSYLNSFYNHSWETITNDAIKIDSTSSSPTHQWFHGCDFDSVGTVMNDVASTTKTIYHYTSGGTTFESGPFHFAHNTNTDTVSIGPTATGSIVMTPPGGAAATIEASGTPGALSLVVNPKGTGSLELRSGLGTGTGVTVSNAAGTATVTIHDQVPTIELGHPTDTTLARAGAGDLSVEGNSVALSTGDVFSGVHDFGSATSLEIVNDESADATLSALGQVHIRGDEDRISYHAGAGGEVAGEVTMSMLQSISVSWDPGSWYDSDPNVYLFKVNAKKFPNGIIIDYWSLNCNVDDPNVEMNCDLRYAANLDWVIDDGNDIDELDTTTGSSSEDTDSNINGGSAVPASTALYIGFDGDPEGDATQVIFEMMFHAEED